MSSNEKGIPVLLVLVLNSISISHVTYAMLDVKIDVLQCLHKLVYKGWH